MRRLNSFLLCVVVVLVVTGNVLAQEFYGEPQQQCRIDPLTGQRICTPVRSTVKAAAVVTGKVVSSVGAVITPNSVPLPMQPAQFYAEPAPVSYPVVQSYVAPAVYSPSVVTYSQVYSTQVSNGWSKSWSVVHGQPVRNVGRRILGR